MTKPNNDLDLASLNVYLQQNVDGFSNLHTIDKFNVGQSNPTFKLTADSGEYVLRRQPAGKLLKSAHAVDREYKVMKALADTDVPVPAMYHLCEDRDVIGSMFYLMEFAKGDQHTSPALPDVDKSQRSGYYDSVIETLAAIHTVDLEKVGLSDFGKGADYFARQISLWTKQYRDAETDVRPNMETLIEWLPANLPADDDKVTLTHGDFKFDNMLYVPGQPKVLAVLDWELSTLGHPIADLAYLCMNLRLPSSSLSQGLGNIDRAEIGVLTEQQVVEQYCKKVGIDNVDHFEFYLTFSFFRLASICQGVYKRSLLGNASNEGAKMAGMVVDQLSQMAVELT